MQPRLTFSTLAACIESAVAGYGIGRGLSYQVAEACERGDLVTLLDEASSEVWPVQLLHAEGRLKSAKVRAFLDLASERLRSDPRLGG